MWEYSRYWLLLLRLLFFFILLLDPSSCYPQCCLFCFASFCCSWFYVGRRCGRVHVGHDELLCEIFEHILQTIPPSEWYLLADKEAVTCHLHDTNLNPQPSLKANVAVFSPTWHELVLALMSHTEPAAIQPVIFAGYSSLHQTGFYLPTHSFLQPDDVLYICVLV